MKRIVLLLTFIAILCGIHLVKIHSKERAAFDARERFIAETRECLDKREWKCAERNIRELLRQSPNDSNLQTHLAGILFEEERYEECRRYISTLGFSNEDLEYLSLESESLLREKRELGIESSGHFHLEFEGNPAREDISEALSVLEVAYDSLGELFHFYPEDRIYIVLYRSDSYRGMGPHPDWEGAVFDGKLRIPANAMRVRAVYRPMLLHELVHAFVNAMTHSKVPLWMNEGIAQVIDGTRPSAFRPDGEAPSLESLSEPFVSEPDRDAAKKLYRYSQEMVERLLRRKSPAEAFPAFRDCIRDIRKLGTDGSLEKHFGISSGELWEETKKDISVPGV